MTTKKDNLPAAINLEQMAGKGQEYVTARDPKTTNPKNTLC